MLLEGVGTTDRYLVIFKNYVNIYSEWANSKNLLIMENLSLTSFKVTKDTYDIIEIILILLFYVVDIL